MKKFFNLLFVVFCGFVNGVLGSGGGSLMMPFLYKYLGDEKKAHQMIVAFILPLSIVSASAYNVDLYSNDVLFIAVGACIGGIIGYKICKKISIEFLKVVFGLIIVYAGVKSIL